MKKKIKWAIAAVVLIALIGLYAIVDKNHSIYDTKVDNSQYAVYVLEEGDVIRQSFVSEEEVLDGINIKISAEGSTEDLRMGYVLTDSSGTVAAQGEKSLEDFRNGRFLKFEFDSLQDCQGGSYTFELTLKESSGESAVSVYVVPGAGEDTVCELKGETLDGTMALRTVTRRFDMETFVVTLCFLLYVVLFMRWLVRMFK